jgi:pimeloyl-ACP methyl ester carboxylesterase
LVHGAWHGAWCWAGLAHHLDGLGIPSYAIDLPGHGASGVPLSDLYGDADHVVSVIRHLNTPVVLVGHSYGGAVIAESADRLESTATAAIAHLAYLSAFALEPGESIMSLLASLPRATVALGDAIMMRADGTSTIDPAKAAAAFYGQCPPAAVAAALPRLSPQPMATFTDAISGGSHSPIPSTYVRCLRDEAIHLTHQDAMAARCDTVHTIDTDHSPFMSRTAETAAILQRLATGA